MQDRLIKLWKSCETKQLAKIFEDYMKSIEMKKYSMKKSDNRNTYLIDGKSTGWNRIQCYYHKDSDRFGSEDLLLVLRKRAGNYLIIGKKSKRAFEVDHHGVLHYDEKLLNEIITEHKPLFEELFKLDGKEI